MNYLPRIYHCFRHF